MKERILYALKNLLQASAIYITVGLIFFAVSGGNSSIFSPILDLIFLGIIFIVSFLGYNSRFFKRLDKL